MLDRCLLVGYVPALIKVDVEGAELQVFEGALETISKYKPVIIKVAHFVKTEKSAQLRATFLLFRYYSFCLCPAVPV